MDLEEESYENYVYAKEKDSEIEVFFRVKNMYLIFTLIFLILSFKMVILTYLELVEKNFILLILYYFLYKLFKKAYIRQHGYMVKRIKIYSKPSILEHKEEQKNE